MLGRLLGICNIERWIKFKSLNILGKRGMYLDNCNV